ncbi:MAG: hypothetical protein WKG03_05915 [Telluria sp.]
MMKRILLFVVLGGLALGSAAQEQTGSSVEVRGSQITLPSHGYPMFAPDLQPYAGAYNLSNGEVMYLTREGKHLYARVGQLPAKKLIAASPNEFVALDRQLRLTLNPDDFGGMMGELLMVVPRSVASTGSGEQVRLISFR